MLQSDQVLLSKAVVNILMHVHFSACMYILETPLVILKSVITVPMKKHVLWLNSGM